MLIDFKPIHVFYERIDDFMVVMDGQEETLLSRLETVAIIIYVVTRRRLCVDLLLM